MKFAIELKPFRDETLSSWIIRNSIANGTDPTSFAIAIFEKYRIWKRDIDRYLKYEYIYLLSKYSRLNTQKIHHLTLEPFIQTLFPNMQLKPNNLWYFIIPTGRRGSIQTNGIHYCPLCFNEDIPYLKKQWKLAWNVACPIHKIKLHLRCQQCSKIFAPHLIEFDSTDIYICRSCNFDMRKSDVMEVKQDIINFQESLNNAFFNDVISDKFPLIYPGRHDLFMTLKTLIAFLRQAHKSNKYISFFKELDIDTTHYFTELKNNTFERMTIDDRIFILQMLIQLFKLDIESIKLQLQNLGIRSKSLHRGSLAPSPTIQYLLDNIILSKSNKLIPSRKRPIIPKTKKEVDKLFSELEVYL